MTKYVLKQAIEAMQLVDFLGAIFDNGHGVQDAHEYLPDGYSMAYAVDAIGEAGVCLYHADEPDWMTLIAPEDWIVFLGDGEVDVYESDIFEDLFEEAAGQ